MKMLLRHVVILSVVIGFLFVCNNVYSQDYRDIYKQPVKMTGQNLQIGTDSYFDNVNVVNSSYNGISYKLGLTVTYNKWYLSSKLNYDLYGSLRLSTNRIQPVPTIDIAGKPIINNDYSNSVYKISSITPSIGLDVSYYPFRFPVYVGVHLDSYASFENHDRPYSSAYIYPYIGIGRLKNMSLISEAIAFENIMRKKGVIKNRLNGDQRASLSELLDRRNSSEYLSMYKDDADTRFMADLESFLNKNGLLKGSLGAKATMSVYQALVNTGFIYYPKLAGWQIQSEIKRKLFAVPDETFLNFYSITFSGIYGKLLSDNTSVLTTIFYERSLVINGYLSAFDNYFHTPQLIAGEYQIKDFESALNPRADIYSANTTDLISGNILLYHNFSPTIGMNGSVRFSIEKEGSLQQTGKQAVIAATGDFNVIGKLVMSLTASFSYIENFPYDYKNPEYRRTWDLRGRFSYFLF